MGIRKPSVSVTEARRLAETRQAGLDLATARAAPPESPQSLGESPPAPSEISPAPEAPSPSPLAGEGVPGGGPGGQDERPAGKAPEMAPAVKPEAKPGAGGASSSASPPARRRGGSASAEKQAERQAAFEPLSTRREAKVQVFLSAPIPAPGASRSFDLLSRTHPPGRAVQMILRRALDLYEARLEDGTFAALAHDYPVLREGPAGSGAESGGGSGGEIEGDVVQTSRMMAKRLVAIARAHFDPLGFESNRAFGRMLATAALAAFFEAERAGRR